MLKMSLYLLTCLPVLQLSRRIRINGKVTIINSLHRTRNDGNLTIERPNSRPLNVDRSPSIRTISSSSNMTLAAISFAHDDASTIGQLIYNGSAIVTNSFKTPHNLVVFFRTSLVGSTMQLTKRWNWGSYCRLLVLPVLKLHNARSRCNNYSLA